MPTSTKLQLAVTACASVSFSALRSPLASRQALVSSRSPRPLPCLSTYCTSSTRLAGALAIWLRPPGQSRRTQSSLLQLKSYRRPFPLLNRWLLAHFISILASQSALKQTEALRHGEVSLSPYSRRTYFKVPDSTPSTPAQHHTRTPLLR